MTCCNTTDSRKTPSFILVGAPKSGTTFLLHALRQNPDIFIPPTNELYFYSEQKSFSGPHDISLKKKQTNTLEQYLAFFEKAEPGQIIGEFATDYLYFYEPSVNNIRNVCGPKTKILILLRNPVDRAFSQYKHLVSKHHEKENFQDALRLEEKREKEGWRWAYQYRNVGLYSKQVSAYLSTFSDVKILIFEEIREDKAAAIREIENFLGVEHFPVKNLNKERNIKNIYSNNYLFKIEKYIKRFDSYLNTDLCSTFSEKYAKSIYLTQSDKNRLWQYFEDDVCELENIIGHKLDIWRKY